MVDQSDATPNAIVDPSMNMNGLGEPLLCSVEGTMVQIHQHFLRARPKYSLALGEKLQIRNRTDHGPSLLLGIRHDQSTGHVGTPIDRTDCDMSDSAHG